MAVWITYIQHLWAEHDERDNEYQHQHTPQYIVQNTFTTDGANLIGNIVQQSELRSLKLIRSCLEGIEQRLYQVRLDVVLKNL